MEEVNSEIGLTRMIRGSGPTGSETVVPEKKEAVDV